MTVLITGSSGLVQIGPTGALTTVGFVSEFSVECKTDMTEQGPYIGDPTIYRTKKAKTSSGKLNADIPEGRNAGQSGIVAAHEAGTNFRLSLRGGDATNGYTYVAAAAAIESLTYTGNAEEGYSFEMGFVDMSGYTLVPSA